MKGFIFGLAVGIIIAGAAVNNQPIRTQFSEYTETDPDFAEINYSDYNRLGDTDFFGFIKSDGTVVILEEDMKWTLEKGGDLEEITERLEAFEWKILKLRAEGKDRYTNDNWVQWATEAIEGH